MLLTAASIGAARGGGYARYLESKTVEPPHSHVVITGAVREDDRIVAVASRPIFRNARELGAFYLRSRTADPRS